MTGARRKKSELQLQKLLDDEAEREHDKGILEIFTCDEDEALTRDLAEHPDADQGE
jgi:hypothetical protein